MIENGEDDLISCALLGETVLRDRFEACMKVNAEDMSKCEQQGGDLAAAAGKFLKRAGVQI